MFYFKSFIPLRFQLGNNMRSILNILNSYITTLWLKERRKCFEPLRGQQKIGFPNICTVWLYMNRNVRKRIFGDVCPAKIQISLRIRLEHFG